MELSNTEKIFFARVVMNERINLKDRDVILKLVTVAVCVLECLILLFTIVYQQDLIKRVETPISEEMAQVYIDHPEKLKPEQRLALNVYSSRNNQRTYLIVEDKEEVIPFPWKAWVLTSVGIPIGLAFLVLLLTRAYLQMIETGEENTSGEASGRLVSGLNKLSQINAIWFMLAAVVVIFLFWYIPEIIKYTGGVAISWLTEHWWVPTMFFFVVVFIIVLVIYLQYRLRSKSLDTEVEIAKLKFLQFDDNHQVLLSHQTGHAPQMIEEAAHEEGNP